MYVDIRRWHHRHRHRHRHRRCRRRCVVVNRIEYSADACRTLQHDAEIDRRRGCDDGKYQLTL